jgi:Rhodopirellula transposase DDE domain
MQLLAASEKKGGRKKASLEDPALVPLLQEAVKEHTAGSPVDPGQLWTNRSPAELADEMTEQGHPVDRKTVQRMLKEDLGLSRRQMVKTLAMGESDDRDAQFRRMQGIKAEFLEQGFPVLSVDTKKKELLGSFYRSGPAWTNGHVQAWDHDFPSSSWGKVIPYGVYDLTCNESLVYLAQGADTGQLAVDALRRWWHRLGKWRYPAKAPILLLADCGGSNGYRVPLFREQLQCLANQISKTIRVCHLPPYCSKYNPIDHRLFCHISRSLQSLMLKSIKLIREAIERTTTRPGLRVVTELARKLYPSGIKASPEYLNHETVIRDKKLPQFNYRFEPK